MGRSRPPSSPDPGAEDSLTHLVPILSTQNVQALSATLVHHLYQCSCLLLKLATFGHLHCQEAWALEQGLNVCLRQFGSSERNGKSLPLPIGTVFGLLALLPDLLGPVNRGTRPFICPVEHRILTFCHQHSAYLSLHQPGLAKAVCQVSGGCPGAEAAQEPPARPQRAAHHLPVMEFKK